jgi:HD superfamily phosphohydrolase YqeK
VLNENYREGMFSSVIAGISSMGGDREAFFLLPVDIPLVRSRTIQELLRAYPKTAKHIVYPTFQGMRGHPPLIAAALVEEIRLWKGEGGLRSFLGQCETDAREVEVADEYILRDINTAADYEDLVVRYLNYEIPSLSECRIILTKKFPVAKSVLEHGQRVAQVARRLVKELNRSGSLLNSDLVAAAGLLHDMAKGEPDHAKRGENILKEFGFPAVAEIVGSHRDIVPKKKSHLNEEEVLYLADKIVRGNRLVPLWESYQMTKERFASDPEARAAAEKRWANTFLIQEKVEKQIGKTLEFFFTENLPDDLFTETW